MAVRNLPAGGKSAGAMRAIARWVGSHVGGRGAQRGAVRAPENVEDTGVWGVGGPAMREPGSTGILRTLEVPGRDSED